MLYSEGGIRSVGIFQLRGVSGDRKGREQDGLVQQTAFLLVFYTPGSASFPFQKRRELIEDVQGESDASSGGEGAPHIFERSDPAEGRVVARSLEGELKQSFEGSERARRKDPGERDEGLPGPCSAPPSREGEGDDIPVFWVQDAHHLDARTRTALPYILNCCGAGLSS